MNPPPHRDDITGLILAAGQGRRMGSTDKSMLMFEGRPLLIHSLERLRPQVGSVLINNAQGACPSALRHDTAEARWIGDPPPAHRGPLAGMLAGLDACPTSWLLTIPCDAPRFPLTLGQHLAQALAGTSAQAATAFTRQGGELRMQPVFSLLNRSLKNRLKIFLDHGGRTVGAWLREQETLAAVFDDEHAFFNVNTPQDLLP